MAMNRVQFQAGLSLPAFYQQFGSEAQCEVALAKARWPAGFRCPHCDGAAHCVLRGGARTLFQCHACHRQTSLIAGTLFQHTHLPLRIWFLALYLISQAKTGLSALALKRHLGVSYPTAWLIQHKLMQTMTDRDAGYRLEGAVQVDDAYLGGELPGGKAGRGAENKTPFIAAVSLTAAGHPRYAKLTPVPAFTLAAVAAWAKTALAPTCTVTSDGLTCFTAVTEAGCQHDPTVSAGRKPMDLPMFHWINTVLGNLKTSSSGAYHAFTFDKNARRYLGAFVYRFKRRLELKALPARLLMAATAIGPRPLSWPRLA